jgi:hypothetical protein
MKIINFINHRLKNISGIVTLIILSSCNSTNDYQSEKISNINDSKWSVEIYKDCINSITFKNDTAFWYSCEMDTLVGTPYIVKNDTIIVDNYVWSDGIQTSRKYSGKEKYIINKSHLIHVYSSEVDPFDSTKIINETWADKSIGLEELFYYTKN